MKKLMQKLYIWWKQFVAKFRSPMLHIQYEKACLAIQEIYKAIQTALSADISVSTLIVEGGMSLCIALQGREFKIVSEKSNNYENLDFTFIEYKSSKDIPAVMKPIEISELKFESRLVKNDKDFGRMVRRNFLVDYSHALDEKTLGEELKTRLYTFLSK